MTPLVRISRELCKKVSRLSFADPVAYVYNPLEYARAPHERYLERFGERAPREALLLGMNPGPFGMAQTGVPFGDVAMVRDFLGITGEVGRPAKEHPQRPVQGFDCPRSEVSGTRLWGWARERYGTADRFFERFFVVNWCPLVFIESSSRNRTPDKLPAAEREPLFAACDEALVRIVETLRPRFVIGVGGFAEQRRDAAPAFRDRGRRVCRAARAGGARRGESDHHRLRSPSEPRQPGGQQGLGGHGRSPARRAGARVMSRRPSDPRG